MTPHPSRHRSSPARHAALLVPALAAILVASAVTTRGAPLLAAPLAHTPQVASASANTFEDTFVRTDTAAALGTNTQGYDSLPAYTWTDDAQTGAQDAHIAGESAEFDNPGMAGSLLHAYLGPVASGGDALAQVSFSGVAGGPAAAIALDSSGGVPGGFAPTLSDYEGALSAQSGSMLIQKWLNGALIVLAATPFAVAAGTTYDLRFDVAASGTLTLTAWADSSGEGSATILATADPTPLPAGSAGLSASFATAISPTDHVSYTDFAYAPAGAVATFPAARNCGILSNGAGGYTFLRLHVTAAGVVEDSNNCPVHLHGYNGGGLYLGSAHTSMDDAASIATLAQSLHANVVRLAFNSTWWTDDVPVPDEHMGYDQWLETVVARVEAAGMYAELDRHTQFATPPCGGSVSYCPPERQGEIDCMNDPSLCWERPIGYPAAGDQALATLAQTYAGDAGVIFDVWNEPASPLDQCGCTEAQWQQTMERSLDIVRQYDPSALGIIYSTFYKDIMSGALPIYPEPNVVLDFHIYSGFTGTWNGQSCNEPQSGLWGDNGANWQTSQQVFAWFEAQGEGVTFGEWGGKCDLGESMYAPSLTEAMQATQGMMTYFTDGNLGAKSGNVLSLTLQGQDTAARYDW